MAITTTPLGFQKPDGNEAVRNGDNVIAANGAKSEELHQDARGRLTVIEAKNAVQDGRLDGVESKNIIQDGRLASIEAKDAAQDAALADLPNQYVPLSRGVLPSGTDLNTLIGPAHVGAWSLLSSNTYPNAPTFTSAAVLEVQRGSGNSLSVVHRLTFGSSLLWREAVDAAAGTWSAWTQAESSDHAAATFETKPDAAAKLVTANAYTDTKDTANRTAWAAADTATLNSAKSYTDAAKWDRGVTTADLNTLQSSGSYAVNATNLLNLPAAVTGTLEVFWGTTSGVQVYTTREAAPRVFRRNCSGSTWGAWGDAKVGTVPTPFLLASTDVLDTLANGFYRSPSGSVSTALALPASAAGFLRVLKNTTTSGIQVWEPISATDPSIWIRSVSATGWTAWARVDGVKALADAKAYTDTKDVANRAAWAVADEVLDDKIDGIAPAWDMPGVSFAVVSKDGAPTWLQVNDTDGGPTAEALTFLAQSTGTGGSVAEKVLPPERNFTISTYTGPRKLRSNPALIVGYGDSHMLGGAVPSTRFMSILGTKFPAATVVNRGVGGNTTDLVAVRAGAIRPRLTFAGGTIPASGPVTVTTTDAIAYRNLGTFNVAGTVAGVAGNLARTSEYTLTFTRTTDGAAVTTGPAEFLSDDYALYSGAVQIILAGRNDIADDARLNDGSVPLSGAIDRAVSAYVAMVEAQTPVIKKTLLLGALSDVSYVRGTPEYQLVTGINQELQRVYPNSFWDLRGYLVNQCIYDAGITPTAEDLTAMEGDTLPPSIMLPDYTHIDVAAHAQVAEQLYAQLISRKLVNP